MSDKEVLDNLQLVGEAEVLVDEAEAHGAGLAERTGSGTSTPFIRSDPPGSGTW